MTVIQWGFGLRASEKSQELLQRLVLHLTTIPTPH